MNAYLVAHRMRQRFAAVLGAGVALGMVLGVALASFACARDTASVYGRVLEASDAETAVVAHSLSVEEAAEVLDALPAVSRHRYQGGFLAFVEEAEPALTGGVLASATDGFALELPALDAGRLPDPDRADEVFVNSVLAEGAGLQVGEELHLAVTSPEGGSISVPMTVTGIGTLPREAVTDETALGGIVVPTRAFFEAHEEQSAYASSRLWLDDPRDLPALAQALSAQGMFVSETRAQQRRGVEEALRPTVTVLVAMGVLASLATTVVAVQVAQRQHDRWRREDTVITALGATRRSRSVVHLAIAAAEAVVAGFVAVVVMLVASPLAPLGPLHELDPAQGVHLDVTVALTGAVASALVLGLATLAPIYLRRAPARAGVDRTPRVTARAQRPSALAGLSLAVRSRRRAGVRLTIVTTAAAALLASVATVVVSGRAVVDEPRRYGVGFDVLALNAFGDQTVEGIATVFEDPAVSSAASFTSRPMLVDGRTVPGLAMAPIEGELGPTMLEGDILQHDDEVVLGIDTAHELGVATGDDVELQAGSSFAGTPPPPPRSFRVVGLGTFAAISQQGTDEARLGVGALVTRAAFEDLIGSADELPEWTVATLDDGTDASDLVAAHPDGVEDAMGLPTRWFTDARPAELLQLDEASPMLAGAIAVALLLLLTTLGQGTWSRTRASLTDLSILRALGATRAQLARTGAWQAVPPGIIAIAVGLPVGVAVGRLAFGAFARSIAVVDDPASPVWLVAALVLAVLAVVATAALVAGSVARRAAGTSPAEGLSAQ